MADREKLEHCRWHKLHQPQLSIASLSWSHCCSIVDTQGLTAWPDFTNGVPSTKVASPTWSRRAGPADFCSTAIRTKRCRWQPAKLSARSDCRTLWSASSGRPCGGRSARDTLAMLVQTGSSVNVEMPVIATIVLPTCSSLRVMKRKRMCSRLNRSDSLAMPAYLVQDPSTS